jgi:predicted RNA binding protein YcfA (HicA-like mRNA interferase family)
MSRIEKLITKLLFSTSDKNFDFDDLVKILLTLKFEMRVRGSHHIFTKENMVEIINLQPEDGKAKPYRVKQVREIIVKYKLWQDGKEPE